MKIYSAFFWIIIISFGPSKAIRAQQRLQTEVLVIGGGTGGTAAAIQAARSGARTLLVEPTRMLGGMLSAAGVSCTDGNDSLPSGIWENFRQALYTHYGTKNLATGWVSETCFEPHVADSIFKAWARAEKNLRVLYGWNVDRVNKLAGRVMGAAFSNIQHESLSVDATITIDATELGDVFALAGAGYDIGTEDSSYARERMAPGKTDIIQDLTWTAILQDFGKGADKTISRPPDYNQADYDCCCTSAPCKLTAYKVDARGMLDYGKLPAGKFMLNWPAHGNDTYLNVIEATWAIRQSKYQLARTHTLGFIYYIQTVLGFKEMGLAIDELDSGLALIPYNREGRRVRGMVRVNINHFLDPYNPKEPLYRTAIAVGDYPVDHHHGQNPRTPQIDFPKIASFSLPLGALIPRDLEGLLVCEKGISVSNIVNGATRLQPVVLLTGQAAGMLAAWCVAHHAQPRDVDIRSVQQSLLAAGCYLIPSVDVLPSHPGWESIQRIGVTGILRGEGRAQGWANKTYFYPDSTIMIKTLLNALSQWHIGPDRLGPDSVLKIGAAIDLAALLRPQVPRGQGSHMQDLAPKRIWESCGLAKFDPIRPIRRWELAVLLDKYSGVFQAQQVDLNGTPIR